MNSAKIKSANFVLLLIVIITFGVINISCGKKIRAPGSNIIFLCLDALRPDHLSCYGYSRGTSPNLDQIAARGSRFTNAFANATWTLPSITTLFTSTYPSTHQMNYSLKGTFRTLTPDAVTLAGRLGKNGYQTVAFTDGAYVSRGFGLENGFNYFNDRGGGLKKLVGRFRDWLKNNTSKPFFAYLHTYTIHHPYRPPPPYRTKFGFDKKWYRPESFSWTELVKRAREKKIGARELDQLIRQYDGGIAYADEQIGRLWQILRDMKLDSNTLLVIFSDHGEQFLEHGCLGHGIHGTYINTKTLYDETLRVPLILVGPGIARGKVIKQMVNLIDIFPSILDYLELGFPKNILRGKSIFSSAGKRREWTFAEDKLIHKQALRNRRWKLIRDTETGSNELYDLSRDPEEKNNIAGANPDRVEKLSAIIEDLNRRNRDLARAHPQSEKLEELSDGVTRQLRALGYAN